MSFNIVDIKVVTDYTDFSNAVQFSLTVPVTAKDADKIYGDLADGTWDAIEADMTVAIKNGAPAPIQALVTELVKAYTGGASSSSAGSSDGGDASGGAGGDTSGGSSTQ